MPAPADPIRLFVTHNWEENEDYNRVFEYLESSRNFYYRNTSLPQSKKPIDAESVREELRRQIAPAEVVLVVPATARAAAELTQFQLNFARSANRPVIALENFGVDTPLPHWVVALANEVCPWNERALVDSLRRQARKQQTSRWETIEFKLD